jgi:enoyl-[acyl-carrier protein] reductase/trans-2-enoyl-CoA reductase (NAD+)
MIIQPKIKGFVCATAHPEGCRKDVQQQVSHVQSRGEITGAPKRVLVIGASGGYGLATRITAAFGCKADTLGVFLEKPAAGKRTASAGWYRAAAFEALVKGSGQYSGSINGDAFSDEIKAQTVSTIKDKLGQVDMVVYSLASPVRILPKTGELVRGALKPIGHEFSGMTIDVTTGNIREISAQPATEMDIANTVKVMGGEDWELWIDALRAADTLAPGCITTNYAYLGSEATWAIYRNGTIGKAKDDLDRAAREMREPMSAIGGAAHVVVMKGLLTQASSAIPGMPLYLSLLYKIMKQKGVHEGCIEQTDRLFRTQLFQPGEMRVDSDGRIRMDDLEMSDDVQAYVMDQWSRVNNDNLKELTDFEGYREGFLNLYGFGFHDVDYEAEVDPDVQFPVEACNATQVC